MGVLAEEFEQRLMMCACTKTRFLVRNVGSVWKTPNGDEFIVPNPNPDGTYEEDIVEQIIRYIDVAQPTRLN